MAVFIYYTACIINGNSAYLDKERAQKVAWAYQDYEGKDVFREDWCFGDIIEGKRLTEIKKLKVVCAA